MKHIFTFFAFVISLSAFAQNSNLIVFNNGGQQFFVVLNGIKQNSVPKTNVKIEGLAPVSYKVKIIFADGKTGDIDKTVYLEPNMEYSAQVVIKGKKRNLRLFDMVALNTSPYGTGVETVTYRPNDGSVYSDQAGQAQPTSTGTQATGQTTYTQTGTTGNVQGGTTNQTGTVQTSTSVNGQPQVTTNVSTTGNVQGGTVQASAGMNGQPQVTTTVSTTGNPQGGTVQANAGMNGQTNVSSSVTTTGSTTGNTQTENVQINLGMNGMPNGGNLGQTVVINENGQNVNINMQTTGIPTGTATSTTTSTQTQTTTSGQNTQTQVNTNMSGANGGAMTGTQTTTTTVNGQTTQVTTNVTGTGMNGQPTGTHTHADGTVHDHNHNPVNTGNTRQPSTITTTSTSANSTPGNAIVNTNGTLTCSSAVSEVDVLIKGIKAESFSDDKMDLVRTSLKNKCINSDQAMKIVNSFTFDGDKIEMSKFCFDHMTDRNNASKLLDLFSYSSSKEELQEYFGK